MRVLPVFAALGLLAFVGTASASDYMLPLLEKQAAPPAANPAQPSEPQTAGIVATPSPLPMLLALVGAAAVVGVALAVALRAERARA